MLTPIADRFVCFSRPAKDGHYLQALDLATGERVHLRIETAGSRNDQQEWMESCTRRYADGALMDFGFIGTDRRFEATLPIRRGGSDHRSSPSARTLDWLDSRTPFSSGILRVADIPDPRDLRLKGFIPVSLLLFGQPSLSGVWPLMKEQSVVLLDTGGSESQLAMAFLKARRMNVREVSALSVKVRLQPHLRRSGIVANAAEGRPAYGPRLAMDSRASALLAEGERLLGAGRHAGAERLLRGAAAAFDRRGDGYRAGEADMRLGRLLLTRGRATDAARIFEDAHDRFQKAHAPIPAVGAMIQLGVAQTDLGLLSGAERSCRAARSAATALNNADLAASAGVALARTLIWLEQYAEARSLLETLTPSGDGEVSARYWCLVTRMHIAGSDITDAWRAVARARPPRGDCDPSIESLVRRWEGAVQAQVGDLEALQRHVRAGLAAARAAHLPLRSIKLRLTLIEGLVNTERIEHARAAVAHLRGMSGRSLPPLLKQRVERTLARLAARPPDRVRETVPEFRPAHNIDDLDGLRDLLSVSHQFEDEAEALTRAAVAIRKHVHAVSVGIFGCLHGEARLFGAAGVVAPTIARRSFDAGMTIEPEACANGVEGAVPMRYLSRFVGALAIRWTVEGCEHRQRAMAFCSAAAAACAPIVYVLLERHRTSSANGLILRTRRSERGPGRRAKSHRASG